MLIQTRSEFDEAISKLIKGENGLVAVDTETYTITKGIPTLIGIAIYSGDFGAYFPFRHQHDTDTYPTHNLPVEWMKELQPIFIDNMCIFHNAKFDITVMENEGFKINPKWYDTMLISHMVNENEYSFALKHLGRKYISDDADDEQKVIKKLVGLMGSWEALPPLIMGKYAVKDVYLTWHLFMLKWRELVEDELEKLWPEEREFSGVLSRIEARGIPINPDRAKELAWQSQLGIEKIKSELDFDPASADQVAKKLFYPAPAGLGYLPTEFGKRKTKNWPKGIPKSGSPLLEKFDHPVVKQVLDYRGYVKAKSTWFDGFVDVLWDDGRVHPTYRQHGTVTTRLSCADPNMQQLPRTGHDGIKSQVKSMLNPPEGKGIWEFDYSQMEYRLSVCYGKDEHALEAYNSGTDFHTLTSELLAIDRDSAKMVNFLILYGGGAGTLSYKLGISWKEADNIISSFWTQYPGILRASEHAESLALHNGWVPLWNGRRRRLRGSDEARKAFNSVIQGGGAQIIKKAMISIDKKYPEINMIAQVHDSIWVEAPVGDIEEISKKVISEMEWPSEKFGLPFVVDSKRIA